MRVLFWMKANEASISGGHLVQFHQVAKHLNALGVETSFTSQQPLNLEGFDLVHAYNISASEVRHCRQQGLPVVLATNYKSMRYKYPIENQFQSFMHAISGRARMSGVLTYHALLGQHGSKCLSVIDDDLQKIAAFECADLILPNAHGEAHLLLSELKVSTPVQVVVNGVDEEIFCKPQVKPAERKFALYCGRFEPHKNQLGLLRALQNTKIPVMLVGAQHKDHTEYYKKCLLQAAKNPLAQILKPLPYEELPAIYQQARVHAIPSFFESTGLASLEAALSGCNVVTGDRGYVKEYFEDDVWYCDPDSDNSIRQAVESAYESPYKSRLEERILSKFTWKHSASQTLQAYQSVLNKSTCASNYDLNLAGMTKL